MKTHHDSRFTRAARPLASIALLLAAACGEMDPEDFNQTFEDEIAELEEVEPIEPVEEFGQSTEGLIADPGGVTCTTEVCTSCALPSSTTEDRDQDGIPDRLEYLLAHGFFPSIMLQLQREDLQEAYLYRGLSIPYQVQPITASGTACGDEQFRCLEIRYAITFRYDHGDVGGISSHLGDLEMYSVVVRRLYNWSYSRSTTSGWQIIRDFTSAHLGSAANSSVYGGYGYTAPPVYRCTGPTVSGAPSCSSVTTQSQCQSYGWCSWTASANPGIRQYSTSARSTPVTLYAAERKHALYHSVSECNAGAFWLDDCPYNRWDMKSYKTGLLQNVGHINQRNSMDRYMRQTDMCQDYDVWGLGKFGNDSTTVRKLFTMPLAWHLP